MNNPQKQIRDLIEQLERDHGIVTAFRVNRHLVAAHDELSRKPLGPKPSVGQVRAVGSVARNLAGRDLAGSADSGPLQAQGSIGGHSAASDCHQQQPSGTGGAA